MQIHSMRRVQPSFLSFHACIAGLFLFLGVAMAAPAEEAAPAHIRSRPAWLTELLAEADRGFPRQAVHASIQSIMGKTGSFVAELPIWFMGFEHYAIPGVFPLHGHVVAYKAHWYSGSDYTFPPKGVVLEMCYYGDVAKAECR